MYAYIVVVYVLQQTWQIELILMGVAAGPAFLFCIVQFCRKASLPPLRFSTFTKDSYAKDDAKQMWRQ